MAGSHDDAHLSIRTEGDGSGAPVLHVSGELDLATAPRLSAAAKDALGDDASEIVFDLGGLDFMDSSGLRVLLEVANQVERVRVRNASNSARRVIESTGVDSVLHLE